MREMVLAPEARTITLQYFMFGFILITCWLYARSLVSFVFLLPHSSVLAPDYNRPAVTESFERSLTATFGYTGSNVSMDAMTDSWDPSGALSNAPCDDVSRFLLRRGHFLQTV